MEGGSFSKPYITYALKDTCSVRDEDRGWFRMKILEARRSLKFKLGLLARQRWCVGSDMGRKQTSPKPERRVSKEVQRIRNSFPSHWHLQVYGNADRISDDSSFARIRDVFVRKRGAVWWLGPMLTKRTHISILMGMATNSETRT
jgi:hypothetical protein